MNFDQLCKDFAERKPKGPVIGRIPLFKAEWSDGRKSANDLLRSFLREYHYDFLNTFDGTVWFLFQGRWRCCTYKVEGNIVQFYLNEFIDN